ncbi:uncharacterized protein TRIADDRAFT_59635 [Trichoplax adhaerens]|uniref:APAF-1 helical domain-containing protein n=1 Tax=Trichoplax adhaerens TaxID=10228 RepID=B3S5J2_TRIAD|nr:predicted protein [Trichoplax adhaerens]EDV21924.1 predicted protein [Trichoplax adhaerens]|eukprot:XP_002115561.1 predicted protein [Trichoplax adhaerens]
MLSQHIYDVIGKYYDKIVDGIDLRKLIVCDSLNQLNLFHDEIQELCGFRSKRKRNIEFIKILKCRDDEYFIQFCDLLRKSYAEGRGWMRYNLGEILEQEARIFAGGHNVISGNEICKMANNFIYPQLNRYLLEIWKKATMISGYRPSPQAYGWLRNVPEISKKRYVIRQDFLTTLRNQLLILNDHVSGQILVHGLPGSGNINENELLEILRNLAVKLRVRWDKSPRNLQEITQYLEQFFSVNKKHSNILFVFDDIRNQYHLNYLKFAKKFIATSRTLHDSTSCRIISSPISFTQDEAMKILAQHYSKKTLEEYRNCIDQVIRTCESLPLAVAILGGLKLRNKREWQQILVILAGKDGENNLTDNTSLLYKLFDYSIHRLDYANQDLFRNLGVFKRVKIPITSIMALWKLDELATRQILNDFNERSLLRYTDKYRRYYILDDLMVDYLQLSLDPNKSSQSYMRTLNRRLIAGYGHYCQGKWHTYPDDGYYYQHFIYHVIQAEDNKLLESVLSNSKWVSTQLTLYKTKRYLPANLQNTISYIAKKQLVDEEMHEELLNLLNQYLSYFDISQLNFIQFLLYCAPKDSWIASRALELAKHSNQRDGRPYWVITGYRKCEQAEFSTNLSRELEIAEKDVMPEWSNPRYGNSRIIQTKNNQHDDRQILVTDAATGNVIFKSQSSYDLISEVQISADGKVAAFKIGYWKCQWKVYNVDSGERLRFVLHQPEGKMKKVKCCMPNLNFCPIIVNDQTLFMTIDTNSNNFIIWKVNKLQIEEMQRYSSPDGIKQCEFIKNDSKIMICQDLDEEKYRVELLVLGQEKFHRSFQIPKWIIKDRDGKFINSRHHTDLWLKYVKYIDKDCAAIVTAYDNVLGLFSDSVYERVAIDFTYNVANTFQPIFECDNDITNIDISDDHRFIGMLCWSRNVIVMKIEAGHVHSYITIDTLQDIHDFMFIPASQHLVVYNAESKHPIQDCNLSVLFRFNKCHNDSCVSNHVIIHYHIIITEIKYLHGYTALKQSREIMVLPMEETTNKLTIILSRYRKLDHRLIFILKAEHSDKNERMLVMKINVQNGDTEYYLDSTSSLSRNINVIYCDDYSLIIHQYSPEISMTSIRYYKLGTERMQTKLYMEHNYDHWDGLTCKITLPNDEECTKIQFSRFWNKVRDNVTKLISNKTDNSIKHSGLEDKNAIIEEWGTVDGNLFAEYIPDKYQCAEYFLIEKGKEKIMVNSCGEVLMKSYLDNVLKLDYEPNLFINVESLWPKKFFVTVDKIKGKILFYGKETMNLLHTVYSPNINNPSSIIGNENQSLFICKDIKGQVYYVIKVFPGVESSADA